MDKIAFRVFVQVQNNSQESEVFPISFVTSYHYYCYYAISSRRQNSDYSPHVVKHPRLDSTSHPFMSPPVIRIPPSNQPDQAVAGSSRLDYDRYYSTPYSPTSSQTYAKDKVLYIQRVSF